MAEVVFTMEGVVFEPEHAESAVAYILGEWLHGDTLKHRAERMIITAKKEGHAVWQVNDPTYPLRVTVIQSGTHAIIKTTLNGNSVVGEEIVLKRKWGTHYGLSCTEVLLHFHRQNMRFLADTNGIIEALKHSTATVFPERLRSMASITPHKLASTIAGKKPDEKKSKLLFEAKTNDDHFWLTLFLDGKRTNPVRRVSHENVCTSLTHAPNNVLIGEAKENTGSLLLVFHLETRKAYWDGAPFPIPIANRNTTGRIVKFATLLKEQLSALH